MIIHMDVSTPCHVVFAWRQIPKRRKGEPRQSFPDQVKVSLVHKLAYHDEKHFALLYIVAKHRKKEYERPWDNRALRWTV